MKRLIWLLCLAGFIFSCGSEADTATNEEPTEENSEAATTTEKTSSTVLNPNLASKEELMALGSITEALAQQILDNRPFLTMTDFNKVVSASVNPDALEQFYSTCFVPLNLNVASEEEFLTIPGVGEKMAHEFEEYRPYQKAAQFRREMGKYVDEAEIARYEQFVFVPVELNSATDQEILAVPGVGDRMLHEFKEYRPYKSMEQFRREIGKYVDDKELARLERFVYLEMAN